MNPDEMPEPKENAVDLEMEDLDSHLDDSISVTQSELDSLLDQCPKRSSSEGARRKKRTRRDEAIEALVQDVIRQNAKRGGKRVEHVKQRELDELMDTSDTVSMSKAELIRLFGKAGASLAKEERAEKAVKQLKSMCENTDTARFDRTDDPLKPVNG